MTEVAISSVFKLIFGPYKNLSEPLKLLMNFIFPHKG